MPKGVYVRDEMTLIKLRHRAIELAIFNRWLGLQGKHNSQTNPPWLGRKHSEEYKRLMSDKHKGQDGPFYGHSHSLEHQEKLRQLSIQRCGPLSPTWRGGKGSNYGSGFSTVLKDKVRERDGFRCRVCRKDKNGHLKLDVHHMDDSKDKHVMENLITLCRSCHLKVTFGSIKLDAF